MTKLSAEERSELLEAASRLVESPPLHTNERFVAATPEARQRYARFAAQAMRFYRGDKPVRLTGDHWKL